MVRTVFTSPQNQTTFLEEVRSFINNKVIIQSLPTSNLLSFEIFTIVTIYDAKTLH
jgi:hypothetical protein